MALDRGSPADRTPRLARDADAQQLKEIIDRFVSGELDEASITFRIGEGGDVAVIERVEAPPEAS